MGFDGTDPHVDEWYEANGWRWYDELLLFVGIAAMLFGPSALYWLASWLTSF